MVVQDFYSLGVINVLTDNGQDLAKSIVDFLTENMQPSSATENSINIPPTPDTKKQLPHFLLSKKQCGKYLLVHI